MAGQVGHRSAGGGVLKGGGKGQGPRKIRPLEVCLSESGLAGR